MSRLAGTDPTVAQHLQTQAVNPQFFAFRWITVLFCQDLDGIASIMRTWDYLLGDEDGCPDALMRLCTAMLLVRGPLLPACSHADPVHEACQH